MDGVDRDRRRRYRDRRSADGGRMMHRHADRTAARAGAQGVVAVAVEHHRHQEQADQHRDPKPLHDGAALSAVPYPVKARDGYWIHRRSTSRSRPSWLTVRAPDAMRAHDEAAGARTGPHLRAMRPGPRRAAQRGWEDVDGSARPRARP